MKTLLQNSEKERDKCWLLFKTSFMKPLVAQFTIEPLDGDQIDGVAMGSPFGSVLANLFMGYYETLWLNTFRECEIILYRRYVDDIICLFNCESDADKFFEFLNIQHPNIKFTFEKQVNKQISFLDVLITNDVDQFYTSVFRKETAIGLFTNYLGFTC